MTARSKRPSATPGAAGEPTPTVLNVVPTPEAFTKAVREIVRLHKGDVAHRVLDQVVSTLLTSLGYGEGMAVFLEAVESAHPSGNAATRTAAHQACAVHCTVCEGQDHHWDYFGDEVDGEPVWSCKHCEAIKPMGEDDD